MNKQDSIYIAGHRGMVGSAIERLLRRNGYEDIVTVSSSDLDLRNQAAVQDFFANNKIDMVFLAAAKVGGILANSTYRADFLYDNLMIATNIIEASHQTGVKKLLNLGSSCIYPRLAPQPMDEGQLLQGPLEPTNEPYAIAKIAAIKLCDAYRAQHGCNYISAMPTNLYGLNDNYVLKTSHVLPALIRKIHEAKLNNTDEVVIWGTGKPKREFLHVDDMARAALHLMLHFDEPGFVNVGTGEDISIIDLAHKIAFIIGYKGNIKNDLTKPDGMPRKLLDVSKINSMGWQAEISIEDGIRQTYDDCKSLDWY